MSVSIILSEIQAIKGRAGSTLEMDSRHKDKEVGFYSKFFRPFLRFLCIVDDFHTYMQKELLVHIFGVLASLAKAGQFLYRYPLHREYYNRSDFIITF